jgi:hypothetical protein
MGICTDKRRGVVFSTCHKASEPQVPCMQELLPLANGNSGESHRNQEGRVISEIILSLHLSFDYLVAWHPPSYIIYMGRPRAVAVVINHESITASCNANSLSPFIPTYPASHHAPIRPSSSQSPFQQQPRPSARVAQYS